MICLRLGYDSISTLFLEMRDRHREAEADGTLIRLDDLRRKSVVFEAFCAHAERDGARVN